MNWNRPKTFLLPFHTSKMLRHLRKRLSAGVSQTIRFRIRSSSHIYTLTQCYYKVSIPTRTHCVVIVASGIFSILFHLIVIVNCRLYYFIVYILRYLFAVQCFPCNHNFPTSEISCQFRNNLIYVCCPIIPIVPKTRLGTINSPATALHITSKSLTPSIQLCLSLYKSSIPSQICAVSCNKENNRAPLESATLIKISGAHSSSQ